MNPELMILLSGALTFGVPLVLAVLDLLAMRRSSGGGGSPERARAPDTPPAPGPAGVRPLPDCLIPKPVPPSTVRAARELEHA
jgi:hypothetical protein